MPEKLHILFYEYVEDIVERRAPHREGHLALIKRWHDEGRISIAGGVGDPPHAGLIVLREDDLEAALAQVGARLEDVVRTRMFVTDIAQWEAVGRAHGEVFADIRPVTAMLEVSALLDPRMMVEIEADAFIGG